MGRGKSKHHGQMTGAAKVSSRRRNSRGFDSKRSGDERREEGEEKSLLWRTIKGVVERLDTESVEERVEKLRIEYPERDESALVALLIREKALRSGLVGGLTALPSNIPILGTIATLTIGSAVDLATLLRYQCLLVIEVCAVFKQLGGSFQSMIDILSVLSVVSGDRRARRELERIKIASVGDRCFNTATKQLLNKVATRVGMKLIQKNSARAVPILGAFVGAGINYRALEDVGRTAERYYGERKNSSR